MSGRRTGDSPGLRRRSAERAARVPHLTIIVPTRNEAENVLPLVERIESSVGIPHEILFVDDSSDATPEIVEQVSQEFPKANIRLHHRAEAKGGLGGAVIEGYKIATGKWACVIDGDLQHPPELIQRLVEAAESEDCDVAIASRYRQGGEQAGLSRIRGSISEASCSVARILFPHRLKGVTDPMSGFFAVRREAIDPEKMRPRGFKLLLELLLRHPQLKTTEVPYTFGSRQMGESKASIKEGLNFGMLLLHRRLGDSLTRFMGFALVGASGLVVNSAVLVALTELAGINYLVSVVLATQFSSVWNFVLAETFVFDGRGGTAEKGGRLLAFLGVNNFALVLRTPMVYVLTSVAGVQYVASNLISLLTLTGLRFLIADSVIWSSRKEAAKHHYDIHGLVTITSDGRLPELERFRSSQVFEAPTIRVRAGYPRRTAGNESPMFLVRTLHYSDGLGPLGFSITVTQDEGRTDVVASPLVMRSPHVLYTNVVEPILRWTFVEKGYALIHGACLSENGDAFLVTARTDTGKTTTVLKILDDWPLGFMSDDLSLVNPAGDLFCYPKPLTISRHTLGAVKTPLLKPWERIFLVVQSRVHSRSGRIFAKLIAKTHLPAATINTLAQLVIPPPKYDIQRLVPSATVPSKARLTSMNIIERGTDDLEREVDSEEGLEILMANTEDAYGFPPYHEIEEFLRNRDGVDLRPKELQIVKSALGTIPVRLFRRVARDWWVHVAKAVSESQPPEGDLAMEDTRHVSETRGGHT
jgi:dolichol-phosphate mannosyltransferase